MTNLPATAVAAVLLATVLTACGSKETPAAKAPAAKAAVKIAAPAGRYELDPDHSSLIFRIQHLGLAPYTARFTRMEGTVTLDPADPTASSVTASIDAASVAADLAVDFKTAMPNSPYASWSENLAQDPQFLNAKAHPKITFRSTRIERTGPDTARIAGDLTLFGQTRSVTLDATLTGSTAEYIMIGGGAIGVTAKGSFKRSDFGMTQFLNPPVLGDEISLEFTGEFKEVKPTAR